MTAHPTSSVTLPPIPLAAVQAAIDRLPALPSTLRYYDDFLDAYHSLRDIAVQDQWVAIHNGRADTLDFGCFGPVHGRLMKHVAVRFFCRNGATTVLGRFAHLRRNLDRFGLGLFDCLITMEPHELRQLWITRIHPAVSNEDADALRAALHACCELNVGPWNPGLVTYVSQLPSPKKDIYRTVRTGDCFVPLDQQALIVDYFDELALLIATSPDGVETEDLRNACALLIVYQHAFRPGQIARIKLADARVFNTGAAHYSVPLAKQRDQQKRRRVSRRVKREWCPIVIEYRRRRALGIDLDDGVPSDSFFGLTPAALGRQLRALMELITDEDWSATDLRHTAAQRLVDAGAAHIVLSEFMGHSDKKTARVYFDTSPTQAQRINQALGLSPIYSTVAQVARTQTIDKATLLGLPSDKQIGGVPHGIPIAGIGACAAGQSACSKNPVLSCYNCRKFMPVNETKIHREVADGLRPVVLEFARASRGNEESPAYTQLRRTIEGAERVIAGIEAQEVTGNA